MVGVAAGAVGATVTVTVAAGEPDVCVGAAIFPMAIALNSLKEFVPSFSMVGFTANTMPVLQCVP